MEHVLIITPAFNSSSYICETIESVRAQTHAHWTLIVIDDASTDETHSVAAEFSMRDPRILTLRRATNAGRPSILRNQGIRYALDRDLPFTHVAFLDSDDYWLPHKLESHLLLFRKRTEIGLSYSRMVRYKYLMEERDEDRGTFNGLYRLLFRNPISLSSVIIRRSIAENQNPLFDPHPDLKAMEDYELWVRLCHQGVVFAFTESVDTVYRVLPNSITRMSYGVFLRRLVFLYKTIHKKNIGISPAMAYLALGARILYRSINPILAEWQKLRLSLRPSLESANYY